MQEFDLMNEKRIPLKEVPDYLPTRGGRKVHYQTVWRWAKHGARGSVLETIRIGHIRYTSHEALKRFARNHSPMMQVGDYQDGVDAELSRSMAG